MPPIEGNFNKELELLWGGKGVAARGPLDWGKEEPGDEKLTLMLHVAITQDDTGVAASGRTGDDIPHGANEFLVAAAVEGDGKLQPGPAMARGWIVARARNRRPGRREGDPHHLCSEPGAATTSTRG